MRGSYKVLAVLCSLASLAVVGCSWKELDADASGKWGRTPEIEPIVEEESGKDIYPRTHLAAGQLFEEQGMLTKAVVQYQKAIAVNHKYVAAYNRLGVALGKLGRHDEAEVALRKAVALRPDSSFAHNNLGFCLVMQQRWPEAAGEFERAIDLNPDLKRAHINLGLAHAKMNRYDDALLSFAQALPVEQAHYNVGMLYMADGRGGDAADQFRMAVDLDPQFDAAREKLAMVSNVPQPMERAVSEEPTVVEWTESSKPVVAKAPRPARKTTMMHPVQRDDARDLRQETLVNADMMPVEVHEVVTVAPAHQAVREMATAPVSKPAVRVKDAPRVTADGLSARSTDEIIEMEVTYVDEPVTPAAVAHDRVAEDVVSTSAPARTFAPSASRNYDANVVVITAVPVDVYEKPTPPVVAQKPSTVAATRPVDTTRTKAQIKQVARPAAPEMESTIERIPASQIHEVDSVDELRVKEPAKTAVVREDERVSAAPIRPIHRESENVPASDVKMLPAITPERGPVPVAVKSEREGRNVEVIQATELVVLPNSPDRKERASEVETKQPATKQVVRQDGDVLVVQLLPE